MWFDYRKDGFWGRGGGRSTAIIHVHEENIQQEVTSQLCTRTTPTFKTHPRARKKPTCKWTRQCWKLRSNDKLRAACAFLLLWLHSDLIWALQILFPHFAVSYWRILGWNQTLLAVLSWDQRRKKRHCIFRIVSKPTILHRYPSSSFSIEAQG